MNAEILIATNEMSHDQWLEMRKQGIGGSDVAAIAGLNKWKSPVAVYLEKLDAIEGQEENEAMYWGNVLEDVVAREFTERTGLKIRRRNAILKHPDHPFMLANVDRLIVGQKVGLECKTANEYLKKEWEEEEIPAQYILQCQHYMAVTGFEAWWIAVLVGGNKFIYKKIDRDEELINYLVGIEKNFWENHVLKQIPPAFDGSDASSDLLKAMYPEADPESEVELPLEADELILAYGKAKEDEKEASERKKEAENKLKSLLGENEIGIASEHLVSWKTVRSNRIETKLLKVDHPEIYNQYAKESVSRRFAIK